MSTCMFIIICMNVYNLGGGTHQFDLNGYRFDSGLHYTVPWSVPIFALTCLKSIEEVMIYVYLYK